MKFITIKAITEKGLDKKVNQFLKSHPQIEIIKFDYQMGYSGVSVGISHRDNI
ncbi:hypothetical protein ACP2XA_11140 [Staphylococcus epidermidis]|uniref:hypothetical protein n=1 Tax=Staphylococcus epidermidis TaxID=1282 RepID=UPI001879B126|nr:hypothetical protein [Staphylococcus epidermidis]MBE7352107.1 hypothetical protein [Staphylococcus epidermidis]MCG2024389.1 hypothetical protein [Staphylococcus epidermidis]MCG2290903.1 hypothetical protein [Staphylococcus epidermidis]